MMCLLCQYKSACCLCIDLLCLYPSAVSLTVCNCISSVCVRRLCPHSPLCFSLCIFVWLCLFKPSVSEVICCFLITLLCFCPFFVSVCRSFFLHFLFYLYQNALFLYQSDVCISLLWLYQSAVTVSACYVFVRYLSTLLCFILMLCHEKNVVS